MSPATHAADPPRDLRLCLPPPRPAGLTSGRPGLCVWQRWLVWLLNLTLGWYGYSGLLIEVLGPLHRHSPAAAPSHDARSWWNRATASLQDWHVRAQAAQRQLDRPALKAPAAAQVHGPTPHDHHHGLLARHHHDTGDASVVSLDPLGDGAAHSTGELNSGGSASAGTGSATLPGLLTAELSLPRPAAVAIPWPRQTGPVWRDAERTQPERPPRA